MKLRSLLVMFAFMGVSVSVAVAAPPPGKGKPSTPGQGKPSTTETSGKGKPSTPGQVTRSTGTSGRGNPSTTGADCRPRVAVVLKGTLASAPGVSGASIALHVTSSNHHGASYANASQPVTIRVDSNTVVRRQGGKTLADLVFGDRVLVQARACKADLANGGVPQLTATRIVAHPASS